MSPPPPPNYRDSIGDDGDRDALRLARASRGEGTGVDSDEHRDWLSGRVASIDAHLDRATAQLDSLRAEMLKQRAGYEATRGAAFEARDAARDVAEEIRALRAEWRDARKELRDTREAAQTSAATVEHESSKWESTIPPGWRRRVAVLVGLVYVVIQAYVASKAGL
jgi:chromosome segregation ATPase